MEASRLEIQWKKICDQEKRSKERNRELLKEFERVEQHASMLAVKTDRLKSYKVLLSGPNIGVNSSVCFSEGNKINTRC